MPSAAPWRIALLILNLTNKEINYKWDYVQSVFFSSTIITTVGNIISVLTDFFLCLPFPFYCIRPLYEKALSLLFAPPF